MSERALPNPSPTVVAVFAHPDDEVFRCGGTLALLAHHGVRVQTLTATRGGAGARGNPPLCTREELPGVREQELRCACRALGIASPRLLDYRDGMLSEVDPQEGAERVLDTLRELRPQALITWPPDGLSGHADHIAVSRWTRLACERARVADWAAALTLYHLVVPETVASTVGLSGLHAVRDKDVTLAVDVLPVLKEKLRAIQCHRTQAGESPVLDGAGSAAELSQRQQRFLGTEHFQRALIQGEPGDDVRPDVLRGYVTHRTRHHGGRRDHE